MRILVVLLLVSYCHQVKYCFYVPPNLTLTFLKQQECEARVYLRRVPAGPATSPRAGLKPTFSPLASNRPSLASKKAVISNKPVIFPALAASFCTAAILYPLELLNALKMANVGSNADTLSTWGLIGHVRELHGVMGFFLQGVVPHIIRSTLMNFISFPLFAFVHQLLFRQPADNGNGITRAIVGSIVTIPEVSMDCYIVLQSSSTEYLVGGHDYADGNC